ncbi:hydroxyethylthiazole kinase [Legionella genomosp. 1]|uniref:hydroxyethylthiazole kinase n=1 Tax=Legionella genomosp. 1 TaxID=1093625 RepID=UPI0013EFB96E|nr:hydroxyethylthiazole kinase [Legionella genomosp. 1]
MLETINAILKQIKIMRPLVLNISNQVTMDFVANGLLALGASPIMTQAIQEIDDLVPLAEAVVINIGTLNEEFIKLAERASRQANDCHKPLVLDPVGAGASEYRTSHCLSLLRQFNFQLLRGNASEIAALSGSRVSSGGVDTRLFTEEVIESAREISRVYSLITVVSGASDAIVDENRVECLSGGSALMSQVTGAGCLFTAVIALFIALWEDPYQAACAATWFYSLCGERAAQDASGPGLFKMHFLDYLANGERLVA